MKLEDSNRALRRALNIRGVPAHQHRLAVERLAETQPHTVTFVGERADQTCATYAFHLTDNPTYRTIAVECDVFAGKKFMLWAIAGRLDEIGEARAGCLVCYFSKAGWQHIGVISESGRVASKWGTFPLYEHDLAEIPTEYGDRVRFFNRPTAYEALSLFLDFARECGLSDENIAHAIIATRGEGR